MKELWHDKVLSFFTTFIFYVVLEILNFFAFDSTISKYTPILNKQYP